jgi:hypothetical protein
MKNITKLLSTLKLIIMDCNSKIIKKLPFSYKLEINICLLINKS